MTKAERTTRFIAEHPFCCFCGGEQLTTTVDHIPPRSCFPKREGPEGFLFPACHACQTAIRLDEQAFGTLVGFLDPSKANYDSAEVRKGLKGLQNNMPELVPSVGLTTNQKRRALRDMGLSKPPNLPWSDVHLIALPKAIDPPLHRCARKLAAALYYREKGKPIGRDFLLWTDWAQASDRARMKAVMEVASQSPFQTIGSRPNIQFGDRFGYRFDLADDNDLFTAVAQFGQGLVLVMLIADGSAAEELEEDGDWVRASAMFD